MGTGEFTAGGWPCDGLASHPGGVEILLVASCYRNWDKLRPYGPLGSYADLVISERKKRAIGQYLTSLITQVFYFFIFDT